ncbi:MAG TPA: phage baseplate assembly protein V [Coleofasciculaceae cyanobacterium]
MRQFFGKYRGKVATNKDPMHLGRIQVQVPAVLGEGSSSWALPCTPYAGKEIGFFTIPPVGANIWVEFEGGDPDYPIWVGCFWGAEDLPQAARVEEPDKVQVFATNGLSLVVSSLGDTKGVTLNIKDPIVSQPMKVVFKETEIEINNNDKTTAKLMADQIEFKTGENSTATIATDNIQLKESSVEVKLTANSIELINNPAITKLTTSGIELSTNPSTVKISASGIELESTPAAVKIAASGVDVNSGALGSIKVSLASVNVNSGALEVT